VWENLLSADAAGGAAGGIAGGVWGGGSGGLARIGRQRRRRGRREREMSEQRRYTAEEAAEIADRAVLESMLEEGCSRADAIRAKIREAFAPARRAGGREEESGGPQWRQE